MAKYLVETYYTCNIKVSHYLDDISENNLRNLEKQEDGKFEILDMKLDSRKTKNLEKIVLNSDKEQISRVFFNLIKNSIESIQQKAENDSKFNKKITIELSEIDDHIYIIIVDSGIGFSKVSSNIKDILSPYFTTKKNRSIV